MRAYLRCQAIIRGAAYFLVIMIHVYLLLSVLLLALSQVHGFITGEAIN